jgi:ribonuclease Z
VGDFFVTILGSNSAVPSRGRYPSAQLLECDEASILIDCGEGTQMRMMDYQLKRGKIDTILISHLHGDHFFGLPGLLTSYILMGRTLPLRIYGPKGLGDVLEATLDFSRIPRNFEMDLVEIEGQEEQVLFERGALKVTAFPLQHRIPTFGFKIEDQRRKMRLLREKIEEYHCSVEEIQGLLKGEDLLRGVTVLPNAMFTEGERKGRSYAYCSDTLFDKSIAEYVREVSCLYHESTFLEDMIDQASARYHSTAGQAARIAQLAQAGSLLLGHYSNRYGQLEAFRKEASIVFEPVYLSASGKKFTIGSEGIVKEEILEKIRF